METEAFWTIVRVNFTDTGCGVSPDNKRCYMLFNVSAVQRVAISAAGSAKIGNIKFLECFKNKNSPMFFLRPFEVYGGANGMKLIGRGTTFFQLPLDEWEGAT